MASKCKLANFVALTKSRGWAALYLVLCFVGLGLSANAGDRGTIVTFDVPGALIAPGAGTVVSSINPAGSITGFYLDANYQWHGFLRDAKGAITSFDPPGSVFTFSGSIDPKGEMRECIMPLALSLTGSCALAMAPSRVLILRAA